MLPELRAKLLAPTAAEASRRSCNIDRTFALMQNRKARRRVLAVQSGLSQWAAAAWGAAFAAPLGAAWAASRATAAGVGTGGGAASAARLAAAAVGGSRAMAAAAGSHWGWSEALLSSGCALAAYATATRLQTCAGRWCVWWTFSAVVLIITTHCHTTEAYGAIGGALFVVLLCTLLFARLVNAALLVLLSPSTWRLLRLDLLWVVMPRRDADDDADARRYSFGYHARSLPWWRREQLCAYQGELHATSGRPHGVGEWVDSALNGECLVGRWEDGRPVEPFRSREVGSSCCFVGVRIGFCATHDDPFHKPGWSARRRAAPSLRFGVGAVEASTSGHYHRSFPLATPVPLAAHALRARRPSRVEWGGAPPPPQRPAAAGLSCAAFAALFRRPAARKARRVSFVAGGELAVLHAEMAQRCLAATATDARLEAEGREGRGEVEGRGGGGEAEVAGEAREALVYIPGFNTSVRQALCRLGQMVALATLPARITPFVFSWAGGAFYSYHAAQRACSSDAMADDLLAFFAALSMCGVGRLHLLAHSMGAAAILSALPALAAAPLFSSGAMRLVNVVLLSPDYPLVQFGQVHHVLRKLGAVTTLYGDHNDRLLTFSEMISRKRSLGRLWGQVVNRVKDTVKPHRNAAKVEPQGQSASSEWEDGMPSTDVLDLDIVDTTWLQAGLPAGSPDLAVNTRLRHTHFSFNQLTVDDVTELIVHGHRAAARNSRLRWRGGNVYHFLVP